MGTRKSPSAPQWQVILEEMKSQNRSTMESPSSRGWANSIAPTSVN